MISLNYTLDFCKHFDYDNDFLWAKLQKTKKPIVIYGMGDGAQKILDISRSFDIKISDIFASDEYVRGHYFAGYRVKKLDEIELEYGNECIILLAFAVHNPVAVDRIERLASKYEFYAPDMPVFGNGLYTKEYIKENEENLKKAFTLLADEHSKNVFINTLKFKLTGDISYLSAMTSQKKDAYKLLKMNKNEIYMDLGAYDGDTIDEFIHEALTYEKIIALEPDTKNFKKLANNTSGLDNISLYNIGVWDKESILPFSKKSGRNSAITLEGSHSVNVTTVDKILSGEKVTIIKMDVEGAERETLDGCHNTIAQYKPRLIVSAYHKTPDLFSLPIQINEISREYQIYLRHHLYIPAWETNIYAV